MALTQMQQNLDKIARTKDVWFKYRRGEEVLQLLEDRISEPPSHRARNILVVGETNNGKSALANRFLHRHQAKLHLAGVSVVPILKVEATAADESRFYNAILEALPVYKSGQRARSDMKELTVIRALRDCGIRMLMIDEFQNLLNATPQKQRNFLRVIKLLGNELMIPIVGLGTREAFNAITSDPQIANRFQVVGLPKWSLEGDNPEEPSEYRQFLATFDSLLPLPKKSDLGNDPLAERIFGMSEGTIGEAADLIRDAAKWSLRKSLETITEEALARCGYVSPSRRSSVILQ